MIAGKQLHYHVDDVLLVVVDCFVLLIVSVISVRQIEKISYYVHVLDQTTTYIFSIYICAYSMYMYVNDQLYH